MLGKRGVEVQDADSVSIAEFMQAWNHLGITLKDAETFEIFNTRGKTANGRMPVMVWDFTG